MKPFASQATLKWIADNRLPTPGHRRYFNAVSEIDRVVFRIIGERRASGADEGDRGLFGGAIVVDAGERRVDGPGVFIFDPVEVVAPERLLAASPAQPPLVGVAVGDDGIVLRTRPAMMNDQRNPARIRLSE